MYTFFITIRKTPPNLPTQVYSLSSYPGLLLDEVHRFKTLVSSSSEQIIKEILTEAPDLLVFMGSPDLTQTWKLAFERIFPQLFSYTAEVQDPFDILMALNPRIRTLRRKRLQSSQEIYQAPAGELSSIFSTEVQPRRDVLLSQTQGLIQTYALEGLWEKLPISAFERILYCLALLEGILASELEYQKSRQVLDVGTHIWSYAPALKAFFERFTQTLALTGLESDGQFLQEGGFLRRDLAQYYARLTQAQFKEMSFFNYRQKQDLICHFLPLILPQNAVLWQIPAADYQPVMLLKHSYDLLNPGGLCLLYNGVEIEYQATLKTIQNAGLAPYRSGIWFCPLRQSEQGYYTLLKK